MAISLLGTPYPGVSSEEEIKTGLTADYRQLSSRELFQKSDVIIHRWTQDRYQLAINIGSQIEDPFSGVFPQDSSCQPDYGKLCLGCQIISRLGGSSNEIIISSGQFVGMKLRFRRLSNVAENRYPLLLASFLEREMSKAKLPHRSTFRWAYQCGSEIVIVEEDLPSLDEKRITPEMADNLGRQWVCLSHFLDRYEYLESQPTMKSLQWVDISATYSYREIKVNGSGCLIFSPSKYGSLSYRNNRGENCRLELKDRSGEVSRRDQLTFTYFLWLIFLRLQALFPPEWEPRWKKPWLLSEYPTISKFMSQRDQWTVKNIYDFLALVTLNDRIIEELQKSF